MTNTAEKSTKSDTDNVIVIIGSAGPGMVTRAFAESSGFELDQENQPFHLVPGAQGQPPASSPDEHRYDVYV